VSEKDSVLDAAEWHGWPRAELDAVISLESGWNPRARNPLSDASGLIQFMPATLKAVGWYKGAAAFRELSIPEQAPWIAKYLSGLPKWRVPGDTYLAVFAPAHVGAPDTRILFKRGSKAWQQNPGLRGADGEITAGSVRAMALRQMQRGGVPVPGGGRPEMPTPKEVPHPRRRFGSGWLSEVLWWLFPRP
jgi:transglycosylase-like protein with SLT domain